MRTWTDAESDRLRELHATGQSLHSIAKQMQRSKQTIHQHAKDLGLEWDRSHTRTATEAKQIDNKARRADLEEQFLIEARAALDDLHRPCIVYSFGGKDNVYTEHELASPSFPDKRNIMQTASIAATAANRLHELNSEGRDLPAVDAWLDAMLGGDQ